MPPVPVCCSCSAPADLEDRHRVDHGDLAEFGRPARERWSKRQWRCQSPACHGKSWTETNDEIAVCDGRVTTRDAVAHSTRQTPLVEQAPRRELCRPLSDVTNIENDGKDGVNDESDRCLCEQAKQSGFAWDG